MNPQKTSTSFKKNHNDNWSAKSASEAIKHFNSNQNVGLSNEQIKIAQKKFGFNTLPEQNSISELQLIYNQFKSPLILILIVAGIVMYFIGEWTDTLVILLAVIINAIFGYIEEHKTSKILKHLKKILAVKATVLRNHKKQVINQENIVPGDIIYLQAGDKIPADGRLIEATGLSVSEAVLTGEWLSVNKQFKKIAGKTALANRTNMVFAGTLVEEGTGTYVVTATGLETEVGKISHLISTTKDELSPLQKKLKVFSEKLALLIGGAALIIFIGGFFRGDNFFTIFETAIAIAVGGIPEALPVVMTVILVIGMERLLKKRGLMRKLSSVETLGSVSVICLDKTKTLTQGKMVFSVIDSKEPERTFFIASVCNQASILNPQESKDKWKIQGNPTDKALLLAAQSSAPDQFAAAGKIKKITSIPFSSAYKYQACIAKENKKAHLFVSGAPEIILQFAKVNKTEQQALQKKSELLAEQGLRVIAFAEKTISKIPNELKEEHLTNVTISGFIALEDALRPNIQSVMGQTYSAGITPVIITGDMLKTAAFIAKKAGIKFNENQAIEASAIDKLDDQKLQKLCKNIRVYARAEPRHKLRIISALQENNFVVGMIGDGVNDAPAIKKADIGIALGSGTEVAKNVSDLVLVDDSFKILIDAVKQGRTILDNLRKSISYVLADSFTSVILVGMTNVLFGWPLPILPVQIIWNNIVEDTLPNIAYAFEPSEKNVMRRGPGPVKQPLLTKEMKILIFGTGLVDEILTVILFWFLWKHLGLELDYVRTMVFGAISIDTAFVIYSYKNLRKNIWKIPLFSNKWINASSVIVFAAFASAVYVPQLQKVLRTVPLDFDSWLVLISIGIISVFIIEATKYHFIARHETED